MSKEVLSDLSVKGTLSIPKTGGGEMNVRQEIEGKQATLSFDSTPTASSTNPVTSGGVKTALNAKQATITGGATTITTSNLTVSRALASNASGKVSASAVTSTELGYLSGVTSAIQTQINSKQNTLTFDTAPTASSTNPVTSGGVKTALNAKQATITGGATTIATTNLTGSRALVSNASGKVTVSAVTATELGYVDGVTSAIQTQLNAKQATITGGATTIATSNLTASRALASDASGKVGVSAVTATELGYVSGVTSGIQTQLNGKQNKLTFNNVPIAGSTNPVTSSGIYDALVGRASKTELSNGLALKVDKGSTLTTSSITNYTNIASNTWRQCSNNQVTNFVTFICSHQNFNVDISPDMSDVINVCTKRDQSNGDGSETTTTMVPTNWYYRISHGTNRVIEQPITIN